MNAIDMPPGNTPLWQLTVDQFLNLLNGNIHHQVDEGVTSPSKKRYVHGVAGIKSLFNCSYPTAHKLKESIIKPAVHQQGRVILVDVDLALKLFEESKSVKSLKALKVNDGNPK